MAQPTATSAAALRALTYRITSTPTKQLPKIASQIAAAIWTCRGLLSAPSDAKTSSDAQTAVHRFKTQLSTLVQDRTVEGRWAAVVLLKAAIEAGSAEILSKSNPWVRSLLGLLKKPDPPTTRILAILTLTRIFTLTWDHMTLIREITTPALTAFIPTCLANLESKRCSPNERQVILDSFATLVPRHPTIFRTNETKLRTILGLAISSASSDIGDGVHYSDAYRSTAARLWVLLDNCAPKSGGSEKWDETFVATIEAAHATCDQIFRAVQEDWQPVTGIEKMTPHQTLASGEVGISGADAASLKPWKGIYAGSERLVSLLGLLKSHISTATPGNVSVRLGHAADLLTRLFGITTPIPGKTDFIKFNNQISRDEREAMFTTLPKIHTAALEAAAVMLDRIDMAAFAWAQGLLDQAICVFRAEFAHSELRIVTYSLVSAILHAIGPSMSKSDIADLEQVLKACCQDTLPVDGTSATSKSLEASKPIQSYLPSRELQPAARMLIQTALSKLESSCITPKVRAQMDRVGVLVRDKDILLSSVMNAPRKQNGQRFQASLLPILAREFPHTLHTEVLLRPRMPSIMSESQKAILEETAGVEGDESEMDTTEDIEERDPTTDLLDALAQDTTADAFDVPSPINSDTVTKRRAEEDAGSTLPAKRFRASPIIESLLPENSPTSPGSTTSLQKTDVPETVLFATPQTAATLPNPQVPELPTTKVNNTRSGAQSTEDGPSDDSDFEMPPLTIEPDTDPEDED